MSPEDYIYDQIYKGALKAGAGEKSAKLHAVLGLERWKKGKFDKTAKLVEEMIQSAKKWRQK